MPTMYAYGLGFGAVALGVARATLDAAVGLARGKESFGLKPMRDNNAVQANIGRAEAQLARGPRLSLCDRRAMSGAT